MTKFQDFHKIVSRWRAFQSLLDLVNDVDALSNALLTPGAYSQVESLLLEIKNIVMGEQPDVPV